MLLWLDTSHAVGASYYWMRSAVTDEIPLLFSAYYQYIERERYDEMTFTILVDSDKA